MKILLFFMILFSIGSFINYKPNLNSVNTFKNIEITKRKITETDKTSQNNYNVLPNEIEINIETSTNNEEMIVNHFQSIEKDINASKVNEESKNYIYDSIDFLFYGKEINGITFNSLTESTKQKIMNIFNKINNTIDEKLPNLKPTIKETTTDVTDFTKDKINDYKEYTKETVGEDNYNLIKDKTEDIKDGIKDSGSKIKEKINSGIDKLSNWYQNKRNN